MENPIKKSQNQHLVEGIMIHRDFDLFNLPVAACSCPYRKTCEDKKMNCEESLNACNTFRARYRTTEKLIKAVQMRKWKNEVYN